tara:strand:- start:340 stop:621 length:282 start_codon:yes stop_codon:yes gene_type:complete
MDDLYTIISGYILIIDGQSKPCPSGQRINGRIHRKLQLLSVFIADMVELFLNFSKTPKPIINKRGFFHNNSVAINLGKSTYPRVDGAMEVRQD